MKSNRNKKEPETMNCARHPKIWDRHPKKAVLRKYKNTYAPETPKGPGTNNRHSTQGLNIKLESTHIAKAIGLAKKPTPSISNKKKRTK
jgi:hypothetical protein